MSTLDDGFDRAIDIALENAARYGEMNDLLSHTVGRLSDALSKKTNGIVKAKLIKRAFVQEIELYTKCNSKAISTVRLGRDGSSISFSCLSHRADDGEVSVYRLLDCDSKDNVIETLETGLALCMARVAVGDAIRGLWNEALLKAGSENSSDMSGNKKTCVSGKIAIYYRNDESKFYPIDIMLGFYPDDGLNTYGFQRNITKKDLCALGEGRLPVELKDDICSLFEGLICIESQVDWQQLAGANESNGE